MFSLKVIWNPLEGIDLGSFTLHFYSLSYVIAFVIGWYIIKPIFKRDGVSMEKLDPLFMYTVIGLLIGARLGHYLFYEPSTFFSNPLRVFLPFKTDPFEWTGFAGMASHGAAIGVIVAMFFYSRKHLKKNILWILDRIVIPSAIGGTFVRLGNLVNSEINGKPSGDFFAGFKFVRDLSDDSVRTALQQTGITDPDKAINALVNDPQYAELLASIPYKHPAQLYEAICYIGVFIILYFVYWKTDKRHKPGYLVGLFFVLLFTVRLLIENIKEAQTATDGFEFIGIHFNTGQLLSVPFILLGLFLMFRPDGMFEKKTHA
ncbi:prolipoprotein diacylglyceryl transferase [Nonlabens sp. Ci31]|jgi:prolipoprotein diacylglyceryl transferase|uniref:prolipoprotein diacylglyceryl transferase n=1 Tax=Nonlabens sp. Ci31 TaxID=2608253 RepID=UPI0014634F45|nr:prolipoprotein diacylglyceryl transferase [Nonlabens sp. Ci31]QJP33169.1 prolipoprotein diacylglyceryl transferase [Nonlabens sp. Ci31]